MNTTRLLPFLLASALPLVAGCRPANPAAAGQPAPYLGPTLSTAEVVARINARNERLPTLWARHYYEATIVDDKKASHFVNGDGALLYRRPDHMLLVGTKPAAGRVFEIGSTGEVYWLKVNPELDTMWWGKYEHLGKPCVRPIPISPGGVFEVLGVGTFNTDLSALPAPVMRFNNDADAYMFVWVTRLADRYAAVKEIWYDRQTLLPTYVFLFDPAGRVQLRAILSNHKPVETPDLPADQWPKVATSYKLYFPDTGTKMSLDLAELKPEVNGVPTRKGIVFPGDTAEEAGVAKVIQLDQECETTGR